MRQKLAFRVDVSKKIGLGHLIRLIKLEKKLNVTPLWIVRANNYNIKNYLNLNNKIIFINKNYSEERLIKKLKNQDINKIIFDISHDENIKSNFDTRLIKLYKKNNFKTISYGINLKRDFNLDISIVPYDLNKRYYTKNKFVFSGPQYLGIKNSKKNKNINIEKILICIGGADVFNFGSKIFKLLEKTNYEITYVSGQNKVNFKMKNNKNKIYTYIKNIKKTIENNDLIICGEGLIKYEAVYSNKPIFLVHQFDRKTSLIKKFLENEICNSYKSQEINNNLKINLMNYINNKKLIRKHLSNQYTKYIKKNKKTKFTKLINEIEKL
tara:strand:- start:510 stop:1484 length:975 start_codon:yes stop_codon:yes gene_type:complete